MIPMAIFYFVAGFALLACGTALSSGPLLVTAAYFILNDYVAAVFKDDRTGWYTTFTGIEVALAVYLFVATAAGTLGPIGYTAAVGFALGAAISLLAGTGPNGWWSNWYDQLQSLAMSLVLVGLVAGAVST